MSVGTCQWGESANEAGQGCTEGGLRVAITEFVNRNTGCPKWCESYGYGVSIVLVGITTDQGEWESHSQGEGRQVKL